MQRLIPILLGLLLATGCSNLRFPGVYRVDIPQGNFVTPEMLTELRPGMSREQVRYALGPPTLRDPFTPDRWHYLLDYQPGEGKPVQQEIVIHFDDNGLARREGEAIANLQARTTGRDDRELKEKVKEGQDAIPQTAPTGPARGGGGPSGPSTSGPGAGGPAAGPTGPTTSP